MAKDTNIITDLETYAYKLVIKNGLTQEYMNWVIQSKAVYTNHLAIDFIVAKFGSI